MNLKVREYKKPPLDEIRKYFLKHGQKQKGFKQFRNKYAIPSELSPQYMKLWKALRKEADGSDSTSVC